MKKKIKIENEYLGSIKDKILLDFYISCSGETMTFKFDNAQLMVKIEKYKGYLRNN